MATRITVLLIAVLAIAAAVMTFGGGFVQEANYRQGATDRLERLQDGQEIRVIVNQLLTEYTRTAALLLAPSPKRRTALEEARAATDANLNHWISHPDNRILAKGSVLDLSVRLRKARLQADRPDSGWPNIEPGFTNVFFDLYDRLLPVMTGDASQTALMHLMAFRHFLAQIGTGLAYARETLALGVDADQTLPLRHWYGAYAEHLRLFHLSASIAERRAWQYTVNAGTLRPFLDRIDDLFDNGSVTGVSSFPDLDDWYAQLTAALRSIRTLETALHERRVQALATQAWQQRSFLWAYGFLVLVILLLLVLLVVQLMTGLVWPLSLFLEDLEAVVQGGDIRQRLERSDNRDLSQAVRLINALMNRLQELVVQEDTLKDNVTGVESRSCFRACAEHEIKRASRYSSILSVVLCVFDGFAALLESDGDVAGNSALSHFSELLQQTVRDADTVARWEKDRFIILLPETDAASAAILAERLRKLTAKTVHLGFPGALKGTFAIAQWRSGETLDDLLKRTTEALEDGRRKVPDTILLARG